MERSRLPKLRQLLQNHVADLYAEGHQAYFKHLGMTPLQFRSKWLYYDKKDGDWMNKSLPCQFPRPENKYVLHL
jgi:hypothetical protein